jgi:hypothetical protein
MAIQQVITSKVSLRTIMKTALFNRGVKEAREGKPFNYDIGATINEQWAYERGRLFGTRFKEGSVKDHRGRVTVYAMRAMAQAQHEGIIL